ncbi:MAG: DUF642 domain-containing protein [Verrucomicrobiota bacterium]
MRKPLTEGYSRLQTIRITVDSPSPNQKDIFAVQSFNRTHFVFMVMVMVILVTLFFNILEARSQPLIQNGNFELTSLPPGPEPAGYLYRAISPGNTNITGWTTTTGYDTLSDSGVIEYIRGYFQDPLQSLGGHIELGFYYTLAGIQQTFVTIPNQIYVVNFYLASNPFNFDAGSAILRVSAAADHADYTAAPGTGDGQNMGWQLKQFSFIAGSTGTTTLQFWNLQGIAAIDGVTVIPEPQSGVLMSLAIVCFIARNRLSQSCRGV